MQMVETKKTWIQSRMFFILAFKLMDLSIPATYYLIRYHITVLTFGEYIWAPLTTVTLKLAYN